MNRKNKWISLLLIFVLATLLISNKVAAEDGDYCIVANNVNLKVKDAKIENFIEGLDLDHYYATGEVRMIRKPDDTVIQAWDYVNTRASGTLDNKDRSIKKGDYFVFSLPEGARIQGLMHPQAVKVEDLYVDVDGTMQLFAVAQLDYTTNKVYYFLTDVIESRDSAQFDIGVQWTLAEIYAKFNGQKYEFTSNLADQVEATNQFETFRNANAKFNSINASPAPVGGAEYYGTLVVNVNYVNPADNHKYEVVGILQVNNDVTGGVTVYYHSEGNLTPEVADQTMEIYKVPDGYKIPDSYGFDRAELINVTDQFTKTFENGRNVYNLVRPTQKGEKFVFFSTGRYIPGQDADIGFGTEVWNLPNDRGEKLSGTPVATQKLFASQIPNDVVIPNKGTPRFCEIVDLKVKKVYEGENNFKPIQVQLFKNDEAYLEAVSLTSNKTEHTYEKVLAQDPKTGEFYKFNILEVGEANNKITIDGNEYTVSYQVENNNTTIINKKINEIPPTPKPPVEKPKLPDSGYTGTGEWLSVSVVFLGLICMTGYFRTNKKY